MDIVNPREAIIALTRLSPHERFPDGRPRVPDEIVERMALVTTEEAWSVLRKHGYHDQFEGNWLNTHPERILVGRAVTAMFVPKRPDLHDLVWRATKQAGEAKHHSEPEVGEKLLELIDQIADIFAATKKA